MPLNRRPQILLYKTRHYTDKQDKTNLYKGLWIIHKNRREFYNQYTTSLAIKGVKRYTNKFQNAIGGLIYREI